MKGVAPQLAAYKAGAVNIGNSQGVVDELCKFLSDNGLSQCDASADAQAGSWPKGNPNDAYAQYFTGQSYLASNKVLPSRQLSVVYLTIRAHPPRYARSMYPVNIATLSSGFQPH